MANPADRYIFSCSLPHKENYFNNHHISNHMLIGLISDVHSNAVALEAVLLEMDALGINIILHAGDIVGYNPYPDN